jgi:hypothetical protein
MTIRRSHLTLALTALAAAVLYNVWYFVLSRAGGPAAPRPAAEVPLVGAAAAPRGADAARDPLSIPAPPAVDLSSAPSWRRDPFLFGDETRVVSRAAAPAPALVPPTVRSILYSAARRLAIVDGRIVGVGGTVGGFIVADIEKGAVVFTAPSGERLRVSVHAAPVETVR